MEWVKFYSDWYGHSKTLDLPLSAKGLWIDCLAWTAGQNTDGFIPSSAVRKIAGEEEGRALSALLVQCGLWEVTEGGFQMHGYGERQRSAADWERRREQNRQRQARFRESQRNALVTRPDQRRTEVEREPDSLPPTPFPPTPETHGGGDQAGPKVLQLEPPMGYGPRPLLPGEDPHGFRATFRAAYRRHHGGREPLSGLLTSWATKAYQLAESGERSPAEIGMALQLAAPDAGRSGAGLLPKYIAQLDAFAAKVQQEAAAVRDVLQRQGCTAEQIERGVAECTAVLDDPVAALLRDRPDGAAVAR